MIVEGVFIFEKPTFVNTINRMWIPICFQPSVHSKTASSTMFYL